MKHQHIRQRLAATWTYKMAVILLAMLVVVPLVLILANVATKGFPALRAAGFFTGLPRPVGEVGGGIIHAILGSLLVVGIAVMLAVPLSVMTGVYLAENPRGRFAEWLRISIDTLQGIPSIVIGLIVYAWVVRPLDFSALAGGVALALMMLPIVTRTTEETIRLIPGVLKEAAYALGGSYFSTMIRVIIPAARSGIVSGILLSTARVAGETAPLLFTAFGNDHINLNPVKPVEALPLLIFKYATSPYEGWQSLAWGGSLTLILMILGLSLVAKVILKR
jgi:phosphate transport system permease protein